MGDKAVQAPQLGGCLHLLAAFLWANLQPAMFQAQHQHREGCVQFVKAKRAADTALHRGLVGCTTLVGE